MQSILKIAVYSNFWVAINAMLLYCANGVLLDYAINWKHASSVLLLTFVVYNLQRYVKVEKKSTIPGYSERISWLFNHNKVIYILSLLALVVAGYLILPIQIRETLLAIPFVLIAILYVVGVGKKRKRPLRELSFLKIVLIGFVWTYVTVFFKRLELNFFSADIQLLALENFLFIVAITIPFDIRDIEKDAPRFKTIPIALGVKKSVLLSILLMIIVSVIDGLYFTSFQYQLISFDLVTILVLLFAFKRRHELYYSGVLEGMMGLKYLLLLL